MKDPILSLFFQNPVFPRDKILGVYLFGSRAKGTERPDSDYDLLLVVGPNFGLQDKDKLYDIIMDILLETGRLISLKIFKKIAFEKLSNMQTPFMKHILTEGVKIG
jgi:predicted nucleotidyltransferase